MVGGGREKAYALYRPGKDGTYAGCVAARWDVYFSASATRMTT